MTHITRYKIIFLILITLGLWTISGSSAHAEEQVDSNVVASSDTLDMPAATGSDDADTDDMATAYPTIRLTQDKSEMVKLDEEAASIIVGNPNHISVLLDTPDTLVVVPRAAGASHFTVMGKDGSVLMQRHVIVGAPKEKYVRIRRSCNAASGNCQEMSTYFCPDTCHEVKADGEESSGSSGFSFF